MEKTIMATLVAQLLIVGLLLSGCSGSFSVPPQPTVIAPAGSSVIQQDGVTEITDPPRAVCLVRARLFKGLVGVPCATLAQEFRP